MRSIVLAALLISTATRAVPADDKSGQLPKDAPSPLTAPFDAGKAKAAQDAWAKSLGKATPVEKNSIGMELVLIPPGKFTMGQPESKTDRLGDNAQVDVTLTNAFFLGNTEVTQHQWRVVMGTEPWLGKKDVRDGDSYPVTCVSWGDAQAFCKQLSQNEKVLYRLPTEAEWEFACRGGTTTRFSFGDDDSRLEEFAHVKNPGNRRLEFIGKVGQKTANPFGLYDIHGNVSEWCQDVYVDKLPGGIDPRVSSGNSVYSIRGGGWNGSTTSRSAARSWGPPWKLSTVVGFRVARGLAQNAGD